MNDEKQVIAELTAACKSALCWLREYHRSNDCPMDDGLFDLDEKAQLAIENAEIWECQNE